MLRALHLGIAVAFAILAVPLYLHGSWVTLGWAVEGVVLLAAGFQTHSPVLRWEALVVLTMCIAKVFLLDTRELSPVFRILSFVGFGVLLLGISFVYQRLAQRVAGDR